MKPNDNEGKESGAEKFLERFAFWISTVACSVIVTIFLLNYFAKDARHTMMRSYLQRTIHYEGLKKHESFTKGSPVEGVLQYIRANNISERKVIRELMATLEGPFEVTYPGDDRNVRNYKSADIYFSVGPVWAYGIAFYYDSEDKLLNYIVEDYY